MHPQPAPLLSAPAGQSIGSPPCKGVGPGPDPPVFLFASVHFMRSYCEYLSQQLIQYRVRANSQMRVFGCACEFLMRVLRSRSVVQKLTLETRINKTRMRVFSLKTENSHDVGSTEFLRGSFSGNSHTQISHIT